MYQSVSYGNWTTLDQTELFNKLDIAFSIILIIAGILTFPPACFVYWRIMTLQGFKDQYVMKLFVLNGFSNMLIYIVNLIAVQFSNWPSMFGFYTWLKSTFLSLLLRFLQEYALSLMWLTTLFISVNRFLSLKNQYSLSKYDYHYFIIASLTSTILSAIIAFPIFFSNYTYSQVSLGNGTIGYIPYIPEDHLWISIASRSIQLTLAVITLLLNLITGIIIVNMRKEYEIKMQSRPEQGLLLSSFLAVLLHILHDACLVCALLLDNVFIAYFITLTIAVATTLPFWTMMICAKMMRRSIFSGAGFEEQIDTTVRSRSATRGVTLAHF